MKQTSKLIAALAVAVFTSGVMAQATKPVAKDEDHKAHHPDVTASAPLANTKKAAATPAKAAPAAMGASGGMHGHMDKHCAEMQKIMKIKDPKKRQKAMDDHMKAMQDEDCAMMKNGMGGGASAPMEMQGGMDK
ncbi:MAG: hypothetical protein ACM3VZ_16365 [Acidobacteriota bacterium]